jgi:hypothetical protein
VAAERTLGQLAAIQAVLMPVPACNKNRRRFSSDVIVLKNLACKQCRPRGDCRQEEMASATNCNLEWNLGKIATLFAGWARLV